MARGPLPQTPEIKLLRGTAQRAIRHEPKPTMAPEPPGWLSESAMGFWRSLAPKLGCAGYLTDLDEQVLALLCTHLSIAAAAAREIEGSGLTKDKRGRITKHPAAQVLRDNSIAAKALMCELGMTPAARARVGLPATKEPDASDKFFQ